MRAVKEKSKQRNDRCFRRLLCVLFLAIGLVIVGVSLAYLTSHDRATNRASSDYTNSLSIVLTEPKWENTGELAAKETVAGKEIDKDPYAVNYMASDVYIRLKIDFVYTDENGSETTVSWGDDASLEEFAYNMANSVIDDTNKTNTYSRFLSTVYSGSDHLLTVDKTNTAAPVTSNNPYFYYDNGWLYYLDYDGTSAATALKSMAYEEKTAVPLFTNVKLPVFDVEYNDLFANGFQIKVTVEAVNVVKITDSSISNISDIKTVFDKGTSLNSSTDKVASYDDDAKVNAFTPAKVSAAVKETIAENGDPITRTTGENALVWTSADATYTAKKEVQVHCDDASDVTSCYVRVCLLPEWLAANTDIEVLGDDSASSITFPDTITENTFAIDGITFTLDDDWRENWIYKDGYFYYKKILYPGEDTTQLLKSVSMAKDDLDAHTANGETLGVSVLTDAVQADGGAVTVKWNATLSSGEITEIK